MIKNFIYWGICTAVYIALFYAFMVYDCKIYEKSAKVAKWKRLISFLIFALIVVFFIGSFYFFIKSL